MIGKKLVSLWQTDAISTRRVRRNANKTLFDDKRKVFYDKRKVMTVKRKAAEKLAPDDKREVLGELEVALKELKLVKQGKAQSRPIGELLSELNA